MLSSLAGKTIWFDRKIRLWTRSQLGSQVSLHGGKVSDNLADGVDYVVIDPTRWAGSKTPAPRTQAEERGIAVLTLDELDALLCPDRDEALALLRGGAASRERWEALLPLASSTCDIDLTGIDLCGLDLSGFTFRRCDLTGARLVSAQLRGANLVGLHGVDFRGVVSLREAQLGSLIECNLDEVDLSASRMNGRFERCSFRQANLQGVEAVGVEWLDCVATEADMSRGNLTGWVASGLNAPGLKAISTTLTQVRIERAHLSEADFTQADLEGSTFHETKLEHAVFRRANLERVDFSASEVQNADLAGAKLGGTIAARRQTALPIPAPHEPTYPPSTQQLAEILPTASLWGLTFVAVQQTRGALTFTLEPTLHGRYRITCESRDGTTSHTCTDWRGGLAEIASPEMDYRLQVDTIRLTPRQLAETAGLLPLRVLCDLFGLPLPAETPPPRSLYTALAGGVSAFFREGPTAIELWRDTPTMERRSLADLRGADLGGADLEEIDLFEFDLTGANLERTNLQQTDLRNVRLQQAILTQADLTGAKLQNASCQGANASLAQFVGAQLAQSDWRGADLNGANLNQADLTQARLEGADLSGTSLAGATFSYTLYDEATQFPEGFTPGPGWISTSGELLSVPANVTELTYYLYSIYPDDRYINRMAFYYLNPNPLWSRVAEGVVEGLMPETPGGPVSHVCRLTETGRHQCASPEFVPCITDDSIGACKHVAALVLSLVETEKMTAEQGARWLQRSLAHSCDVDREQLTDLLTRYAETTQTDYRPNETLPEDYYAL